ncbi:hypothetical protein ACOSQ3_032494 [Xanthoceras sorbifolium]
MDAAKGCKDENNCVRCPCHDCQNAFFKPLSIVQAHLYEFGIAASYDKWIFHGEEDAFVDTGGFIVGGLHMNHEDETNIDVEGGDEMYDLMHDMLGSTLKVRVIIETLPEYNADLMSTTDEENIETLSTLFSEARRNLLPGLQSDDLESQLFHRDDVNADMIEDPSLHEERTVTTQNMDDFICNEDEEDETIENYYSYER